MSSNIYDAAPPGFGNVPLMPQKLVPAPHQRSPRFNYWLAFFMFSLIVTGASIEATDRVQYSKRGIRQQKWAVSCSMLSFILSSIVVILHFFPVGSVLFVGSKLEGLVAFIMIPLWSALVAVISDAANGLAVDAMGSVSFGNLYYCGWAGFVCAIMLFLNFMSTVHQLDVREELRKRSDRLNLWVVTLICSLVLMSSSANIYDYYCVEKSTGAMFCNRSLLAILVGSVASVSSIIVIGMKLGVGTAPFGVEVFFSTGLFLANCFSWGLVTSEEGPGAKVGNLYYFSWLCLAFPLMILGSLNDQYEAFKEEAAGHRQKTKRGYYDEPSLSNGYHEGDHSQQRYCEDDLSIESDLYLRKSTPNYDREHTYAEDYPRQPQ